MDWFFVHGIPEDSPYNTQRHAGGKKKLVVRVVIASMKTRACHVGSRKFVAVEVSPIQEPTKQRRGRPKANAIE